MEQIERVRPAGRDAQRRRRAVEVQRLALGRVQPAEVDREPSVDEDPDVVVASERERLASKVLERRVQLGREAVVVTALASTLRRAGAQSTIDARRLRMRASASDMIRSMSSFTVGMSWINPATIPQLHAPASTCPSRMTRG